MEDQDPNARTAGPEDTAAGATDDRARARKVASAVVADLKNRFTYHPPQQGQPALYEELRSLGLALALRLSTAVPPGRELALAITHLETAVFWANAGIARKPETTPGPEEFPGLHGADAKQETPNSGLSSAHAFQIPAIGEANFCGLCGNLQSHPLHISGGAS